MENNKLFFTIGKSFLITVIVAATLSFLVNSFGVAFLPSFLFFLLFQYVGFYFYGEHLKRKADKLKIDTELKLLQEQSKQKATVICPCDRGIETTIPINVNGENKYKCPGCIKDITVFVTTKTALATTPTDTFKIN